MLLSDLLRLRREIIKLQMNQKPIENNWPAEASGYMFIELDAVSLIDSIIEDSAKLCDSYVEAVKRRDY